MYQSERNDVLNAVGGKPPIDFYAMEKGIMEETKKKSIYFTTGCTLLDLVVGGGEKIGYGMGYEAGTIVRDWGNTSSSKTLKLNELLAANYYRFGDKFKWVYDDTEFGNKFDSKSLYGFDIIPPDPEKQTHSRTVEEMMVNVHNFLNSLKDDEMGIYALDSLDGLSSKEMEDRKEERIKAYNKGKEFNEGTYGMGQAKFLSQEFFRGLSAELAKKNALLYIVSQERDNVNAGLYQAKNRLGGGRAITFYETCRIYSKYKQDIEVKGRTIGIVVDVTAEKVRHPRPYRKCFIPIYFNYGMDDIGANIDFLYDLRTKTTGELTSKVEVLDYDGQKFSRDDLIQYIDENHLTDELRQKVIDKWEDIENSIVVQRSSKYGEIR